MSKLLVSLTMQLISSNHISSVKLSLGSWEIVSPVFQSSMCCEQKIYVWFTAFVYIREHCTTSSFLRSTTLLLGFCSLT